ncbi:hypothetical protein GOODEAATRI_023234 [Goodea atripinnis]|uniref:Uncharacterized protein n=1 Tax=Goodea atripinnis TaxID=208336 RepID=A0ABV0Q0C5_9TELE
MVRNGRVWGEGQRVCHRWVESACNSQCGSERGWVSRDQIMEGSEHNRTSVFIRMGWSQNALKWQHGQYGSEWGVATTYRNEVQSTCNRMGRGQNGAESKSFKWQHAQHVEEWSWSVWVKMRRSKWIWLDLRFFDTIEEVLKNIIVLECFRMTVSSASVLVLLVETSAC